MLIKPIRKFIMRRIRMYMVIFMILYLTAVLIIIAKQGLQSTNTNPSHHIDHPSIEFHLSIIGSRHERLSYTNASSNQSRKGNARIILIWDGPGEIDEQNLGGCPDYNCAISHDRQKSRIASAIVFMSGLDAPADRYSWQYYVFYSQESPAHSHTQQPYKYFFNLTLSYRRDSDAPSPYGYALKRPKANYEWKRNFTHLVAGKKKLVAWFVSNCAAPSGRDLYVNELRKWIPIDIYGSCGKLTCPRKSSFPESSTKFWSLDENEEEEFETDKDECDRILERDYKFYLALENSVCKDYVTEKFWQKLTLKLIVIVMKRSIVEQHAPPGSFIAADDFASPRELAAYLWRLDRDRAAYEQFFDWRIRYRPVFLNGRTHDTRERPWGFCTLCKMIVENRTPIDSYENMNDWWEKRADCDHDFVRKLLKNS